jgi:hypothetical protein
LPPFSGGVECWECSWWAFRGDEEYLESGLVLAVTWFDARALAFARLAELGLYDVVPNAVLVSR